MSGRDVVKRVIDVTLALLMLVLGMPLLVGCAIAIAVGDGLPVVFRQTRLGKDGRSFTMYKFRTMRVGAESSQVLNDDGSVRTVDDDERITRVGGWLRRTSLDELPNLWNVVRGDMSLVGPRPDLLLHEQYYTEEDRRKLTVRPGITGLAQVSGRNELPWKDRLALDVEYVDTRTLRRDLAILARTVGSVFGARGVYDTGREQEE
ncbi:MAG: sugar transferase [Acidimicrobiia bacterium]